jgi:SPX domain protein involved in polyphosphate accumulation
MSESIAEVLKYRLSLIMDLDENSTNEDHTYNIRSLYFDDIYDSAYYEKVDGVEERNKYRIRLYNNDDTFIRLERKEKNRDLTYKRQQKITKKETRDFISSNFDNIDYEEDTLIREFALKYKMNQIRPSVIVDYNRLAYTYPVEDVRITFDSNIKSGRYNTNLLDKDIMLVDILEPGLLVLEVKYNNYLPSHIASILNDIPMTRLAVSKFALCVEKKEG